MHVPRTVVTFSVATQDIDAGEQYALAQQPLYIMHLSVHGLIRSQEPEIGCDLDTGGQVRYVLDLLSSLESDDRVRRVDLVTRRIVDPRVSPDYARRTEITSSKAAIRRVDCGPRRYLRKELLWPHLAEFVDGVLSMIRSQGDLPDVLHAHYADAGFVAARLSKVLGIPVVFTGHSLGRFKLQNLLARKRSEARLFEQFALTERFEAEEETIENASLLIASSSGEEREQYSLYDHYDPARIMVNPPGCDIARFGTAPTPAVSAELKDTLARFLRDLEKPALILLARPDPQKNISAAIESFAKPELRDFANLILFLGQRDDVRASESVQKRLFHDVFYLVDRHDLYGRIAYPKRNPPDMAAALFHFARQTGGLLLAPSRHENFGLTLVEAAAAGLPVVTSGAGGMSDIIEICDHGTIANPDNPSAFAQKTRELLDDRPRWEAMSKSGVAASHLKLTWKSHIDRYVPALQEIAMRSSTPAVHIARQKPLGSASHLLVCDIDDTLTGDPDAIATLNDIVNRRHDLIFGVATGRKLENAIETLKNWSIAEPQFLITAVGTAVHTNFGRLEESWKWRKHIQFRWRPDKVRSLLASLPYLRPQEPEAQSDHKISYYCDNAGPHTIVEIKRLLRRNLLQARVIVSRSHCVDVLPVRASKGHALRFLATQWRVDLNNIFAAGDSGNDLDMIRGVVKGIVVGNHSDELETLRLDSSTYFSPLPSAAGVLDGLMHYGLVPSNSIASPVS